MQINLIPVCDPGISHGGRLTNKAIELFTPYLLTVVIVYSEEDFNGEEPSIEDITAANLNAVIALFREPNTIGMVTGFIHLEGMNINLSGTGGAYGEDLFNCLKKHNIEPWLYSAKKVYDIISEYAETKNWRDYSRLDIIIGYWKTFIINEIATSLYHESWFNSWKADNK